MYIRDIMATNVVTIPSSTGLADARRIMEAHHIRRLPVVDKGKLVGIVTGSKLEKASPSKATSLSVWELSYLLEKTTVKEIMDRDVVTTSPDATVEESVVLAQSNKVGCVVVVEEGRVVGMTTTNDLFYKIINPILGLGEPGTRVEIKGGGNAKSMEEIISTINKLGLNIITCHIIALPGASQKDIVVHLDTEDASQFIAALEGKGYKLSVRRR